MLLVESFIVLCINALHEDLCYIIFITVNFICRMGTDWNDIMSQYGSFLSQSTLNNQDIDHVQDTPSGNVPEGSTPATTSKKGATHSKLANFSCDEDIKLCRAWLSVSCDPIINTGHKKLGFWTTIIQLYNSRHGDNPERSTKSLMSRWNNIKSQCFVFSSYMSGVLCPSGLTNADKLRSCTCECVFTFSYNSITTLILS